MEPTKTPTTDIYHWVAWAHANRKRLALWVGGALVVGLAVGLWIWNGSRREADAAEALSNLKAPTRAAGTAREHIPTEALLKVANDYAGTGAAARAVLMAAGNSFDAGKYKEAQGQFEKFLTDYPDSPWVTQAQLGVAASFEAQGNIAEAATRYKQFVDRHPQDASLPQARSALARQYVAQNKPDQALKIYEEMARERNNDSWTMEASILGEELLVKFPELRPKPTPAPPVAPSALPGLVLTGAPPAMAIPAPLVPKTTSGTNLPKP